MASPSPIAKTYYPRSAQGLHHTYFLLRQRLPHELVLIVLDLAEYWTESHHLMIRPLPPLTGGPRWRISNKPEGEIILRTSPIKEPRFHRVKRVVFKVRSHDQGWSDRREDYGSLRAWTWFEAYVRSSPSDKQPSSDRPLPRHDRVSPSSWSWTERRLITNPCAQSQASAKMAEWRWDADDAEERKIVRGMTTGHSIVLTAHAYFRGWENSVYYAEVLIYRGMW